MSTTTKILAGGGTAIAAVSLTIGLSLFGKLDEKVYTSSVDEGIQTFSNIRDQTEKDILRDVESRCRLLPTGDTHTDCENAVAGPRRLAISEVYLTITHRAAVYDAFKKGKVSLDGGVDEAMHLAEVDQEVAWALAEVGVVVRGVDGGIAAGAVR